VNTREAGADDWLALGELAHIVGRRDDARDAYEHYLALEPDDAEVEQILLSLRGDEPPPRAPDRCIQQLYSRFAAFYETNMRGDLEYQAPERIGEALAAALGPRTGLDVLELGCGTGLAAPVLRPYARRLTGIDLSPEMVEKARAGGRYDTLEVAEITAWLARDTTTFDLVVACDTLIYFGDLRQITVPVASRLRPSGVLVFTVERDAGESFRLTDSGRYAHSLTHVQAAVDAAGLQLERVSEGLLRYEYGAAVTGLVVTARRP
jgi:predicted TPR repeat methyltransferase